MIKQKFSLPFYDGLMVIGKEVKYMKKQLAITALAITLAGAGLFTSGKVFAQSTPSSDPMSSIVQKIADKFGLNKSDVQAVFDQERTERQAEMEAKYETQLTQYVTEGKITEAQKQLIITKHKEMQANRQTERQTMQGKTAAERKTAMETKRTELETWASQNGIDVKYLMGGMGMKGHGGFRGAGGPPDAPTETQ